VGDGSETVNAGGNSGLVRPSTWRSTASSTDDVGSFDRSPQRVEKHVPSQAPPLLGETYREAREKDDGISWLP